jgi:Asp-tRNA(Asn)/Glu-tRNA(Gln) amidotransferase B subunit
MGYFVGAVMRETQGEANPAVVNDVLARRLGG